MEATRHAIVALHLAQKSTKQIVNDLRHLKVTRLLVYRTIKRYRETGSVHVRHGGGHLRTATSPANVKMIASRMRRNPRRSARQMARETGISKSSVQRILRDHLRVKAYKLQRVQELTATQKKVRLERCKALKTRYARMEIPNLVFSDEKIFTVQQVVNRQNHRVYLRDRSGDHAAHLQVGRSQAPASVMVWAAVTADGRAPLVFLPEGVKVNASVYRERVLEASLKPWTRKHFRGETCTFQQDSAPSHKARETQQWLRENVPRFIAASDWPPYSPDLNPLDFCVWGYLESKVCTKRYPTIHALKTALLREWERLPQDIVRAACSAFPRRLGAVIKAKGGHIE